MAIEYLIFYLIILLCSSALPLMGMILFMVFVKKPVILLSNMLDHMPIELRATLFPSDYVHKVIKVSPGSYKAIGAVEFSSFHDNNTGRPAIISIFVNGSKITDFCFSSRDFITYEKIVIRLDANGRLVITGVKAPCTPQVLIKHFRWIFRGKSDGQGEVVTVAGLKIPEQDP
ncbi:hypothetical protein TB2_039777 [Malus domestica]